MDWLRRHPYTASLFAISLFIAIGAVIVSRHLAPPPSSADSWQRGGSLVNTTSYVPSGLPTTPQTNTVGPDPVIPDLTHPSSIGTATAGSPAANTGFDYGQLLAALSAPSGGSVRGAGSGESGVSGYAFIPSGYIAINAGPTRTKEQQELYAYANNIGTLIQNFETLHKNMASILTDEAADREDQTKAAALKGLGQDFKALSGAIGAVVPPSSIASEHSALVQAYANVGDGLSAIPDAAAGDSSFIAAIKTYDGRAESLVRALVSIATSLELAGVTFAEFDPGSVFMFQGGSLGH